MSWLSEVFKKLKGGRSDAEFFFGLAVLGMKPSDKSKLKAALVKVQYSVMIADNMTTNDPRIAEALKWVNGALDELG